MSPYKREGEMSWQGKLPKGYVPRWNVWVPKRKDGRAQEGEGKRGRGGEKCTPLS